MGTHLDSDSCDQKVSNLHIEFTDSDSFVKETNLSLHLVYLCWD